MEVKQYPLSLNSVINITVLGVCSAIFVYAFAPEFSIMRAISEQTSLWFFVVTIVTIGLTFFINYVVSWHKQTNVLRLRLSHKTNELQVFSASEEAISDRVCVYRVEPSSRANSIGIWLELAEKKNEHAYKVNKTLFIGCWQISKRGFRALHRHVIWFV
ncbi:hypothetical protein PN836_018100 [Ningiella sp. W23]|uniref:hypothetical protein n=1 Tax=Ningiella sp. W23 TaxID=3023715 RepID=UPI0037568340